MMAISVQLPTRNGTLGRLKLAARASDSFAAARSSADTRESPEPANRSPMRRSSCWSVSMMRVPSRRRYISSKLGRIAFRAMERDRARPATPPVVSREAEQQDAEPEQRPAGPGGDRVHDDRGGR